MRATKVAGVGLEVVGDIERDATSRSIGEGRARGRASLWDPALSLWLSYRQLWEPSQRAGTKAFSIRLMAVWPIPLSQAPPSWLTGVARLSHAHLPPLQPRPVPWGAAFLIPCSAPAALGLWLALLAVSTKALWLGQLLLTYSTEKDSIASDRAGAGSSHYGGL